MRQLIKSLVPQPVLDFYRAVKKGREDRRNSARSTEQVFTDVYAENKWGGDKGEFYSGTGTTKSRIAEEYIHFIEAKAEELNFAQCSVVDLGCGDFRIGQRIHSQFKRYLGVDIVQEMVDHHQQHHGTETVQFKKLNIIEDQLPAADVCLIRQVFQHLSNDQILLILPKLQQYQHVFVTEHIPSEAMSPTMNLDKVQGGGIRLEENSGIDLRQPPFNIDANCLKVLLEVEGHSVDGNDDRAGLIQTVHYQPK